MLKRLQTIAVIITSNFSRNYIDVSRESTVDRTKVCIDGVASQLDNDDQSAECGAPLEAARP